LFVRNLLMHREQTVNDCAQPALAGKLAHPGTELCTDGTREQKAMFLQKATDLVLKIATDADETGSRDQQSGSVRLPGSSP
jgi:hypothetical protein